MKHFPITPNFKYPDLSHTDFRFGSASQVPAVPLRENGDWRDFLPQGELQMRHGVETSVCFIEAQQHAIATIMEEVYFIINRDFAARWNLLHVDGSPEGGSPIEAAQSFRHDGLIAENLLPFSDDISSWDEFNSYKGGDEKKCKKAGEEFLKEWDLKWDIVIEREDKPEDKKAKLREALKYSPVPISVPAWFQSGDVFVRPPYMTEDNHLTLAVFMDAEGHIYVFDTYEPFIKKLDKDISPEFGIRWSVKKLEVPSAPLKKSFLKAILDFIIAMLKPHGKRN